MLQKAADFDKDLSFLVIGEYLSVAECADTVYLQGKVAATTAY